MNLTVQQIDFFFGSSFLLIALALFLHFYRSRLLSHSLKICNWICGMAISSDSPWVKMLVLHLVFFIRFLMYLAIVSLEQVDKFSTRGLFKHYVSGMRLVLSEYLSVLLDSSEEVEKFIRNLNSLNSSTSKKEQYLRK